MLEFDTTDNKFLEELLETPLDIRGQVAATGTAAPPSGPGLGVVVNEEILRRFEVPR